MSAPRSPTETKAVPSGGRPIVSTVSAQTADSRVSGVTPLGSRAQIVWWARPSVAPEGSTARQLWAKNPVPRSSPTRPAPLSARCGDKSRIVSSWTMRTIGCRAAAAWHCATCGFMTASRVTAPQSNSRYPALVLASEPSCRGKLSSGARAIAAIMLTRRWVRLASPRSAVANWVSAQRRASSSMSVPSLGHREPPKLQGI